MIQKITSKRVELPPIFLIETKEDFDQLPKGLPYIIGSKSELPFIVTFLEFQVLLKSCMKTGIPVDWLGCLKRIGYNPNSIREYVLSSGGNYGAGTGGAYELKMDNFIDDQYVVDFDRLSELKILPVWLDDLKTAIQTNIIDEVTFDPTAFNKQLGMHVGGAAVKHNKKNLLILDISASIPKGVVITITNLAKLMSKKFFADIILTGRESTFIDYDDVPTADILGITRNTGGGNEGVMYKKIVEESKDYATVIAFGDNDSPGIEKEDDVCKFKCETLYSLHTERSSKNIVGYARCLSPKTVHKVNDWVSTIK